MRSSQQIMHSRSNGPHKKTSQNLNPKHSQSHQQYQSYQRQHQRNTQDSQLQQDSQLHSQLQQDLQQDNVQSAQYQIPEAVMNKFEELCSICITKLDMQSSNEIFLFDICSSSLGSQTSDCEVFYVINDIYDLLKNVNDYSFVKRQFKNINGVYEICDVLRTVYETRINYIIVGEWNVHTYSYLTDFFETVLEDRIEDIYNNLLQRKRVTHAHVQKPNTNVWKNPHNLSVQKPLEQEDNSEVILPTTISYVFMVHDEKCYEPPVVEYNVYGINSHIFSLLYESTNTIENKNNVKIILNNVFWDVYCMERIFFLERLIIENHVYGLLIKFSVKSVYVGECNKTEKMKRDVSTRQMIISNTFHDYLNRPMETYGEDDDDSSDEMDEDMYEHHPNNFVEEKTENFLIEEEEIF